MPLKKTKLLDIKSVTGIATVGIFTAGVTNTAAGVAGTTYIRSVIMHNTGVSTTSSSLYVYPNGVAASGAGNASYRLVRVDLDPNETFFFESNYPIVLTNQDKVVVEVKGTDPQIGGSGIGTVINYQILGDTDI